MFPLDTRMQLYSACFARAMEADCPDDVRANCRAIMAALVPTPRSQQKTRGPALLSELIRDAIDDRLHGDT